MLAAMLDDPTLGMRAPNREAPAPRSPDAPKAQISVRPARSADDWAAVRAICCRTGVAGEPVEPERWPLFGELWIGPYQQLRPEWTYVAEVGGQVAGYLTGCPDTAAFEQARPWAVTLRLLLRLARGRYAWNADARRFVRRALGLVPTPEARFPAALRRQLLRDYPAHLHMNVDAPFRRAGVGSALVARYGADLEARRVPGVHLFCGPDPRPFYTRLGFRELAAIELPSGGRVHALARPLAAR
jgi:GNAT superfamily N-acetyltransferase